MADAHSYSKEVAKGSFWSIAGAILFKLSSFFYVILIARAASPDDVGIFYLALGIVSLVSVFSDFGMPASLQRYVPFFEGKGEKRKIADALSGGYLVSGGVALISTITLWFLADPISVFYDNLALADALRFLSGFVFLDCLFRINTTYLQGRGDIKSMQAVTNIQNLLKLLLTLLFFQVYGASITTLTGAFVLSMLMAWLFSLPFMKRGLADIPISFAAPDTNLLKELIPFGFMMTLLGSIWVVIFSTDKLLMGYFLPSDYAAERIAIYSMAGNLAFVLTMLSTALDVAFLPIISRAVGKNQPQHIRSTTSTVQRWALLITIPAAIVMILFAAEILDVLYGEIYSAGAMVMAILVFAFLIKSVLSTLSQVLAAMRLVFLELKIALVVAAINIVLNILLIPTYGIEGAAIATLAGFVTLLLLLTYYAKKSFGFTFHPGIYKIVLAGLLAFLVVLIVKQPLSQVADSLPMEELDLYVSKVLYMAYVGALMFVSLVLFLVAAMGLKCLHPEDLAIMEKILAKAGMPRRLTDFIMRILSFGVPSS